MVDMASEYESNFFKEESKEVDEMEISSTIYSKVKLGNLKDVTKLIKKRSICNYLKENSLNIVPSMAHILSEDFCHENTEICIEHVLIETAKVANTKEVILALLEVLEIFKSGKELNILIRPIHVVLSKEISRNSKFKLFSWVFNTLYKNVCLLPLPSSSNFEEEERKLLDCDNNVVQLCETISLLCVLYEEIFNELMSGNLIWCSVNSKEYFAFYLLKFFGCPFVYLDIYQSEADIEMKKSFSKLYKLCLKYFDMVVSLLQNPFKLLIYIKPKYFKTEDEMAKDAALKKELEDNCDIDEEEEQISQLSLSSFFYCLFGQRMSSLSIPCVYSARYLYLSCLPCCVHLISDRNVTLVFKGLILLRNHLNNICNGMLSIGSLDAPNHYELMLSLVNVMTLCDNQECRTIALNCFKSFLWKFESCGTIKLFTTILTSVNHSGIQSVVIHELKENIYNNFTKGAVAPNLLDENFNGNKMRRLFQLIFCLPDGERSDLLECSDKIMSALNLVIFLCIRDINNTTGFKDLKIYILEQFLQPLENGLRLSKGHYKLKLKELEESNFTKSSASITINVGEGSLPNLPPGQEKQVIPLALNWFDMMQSVLARANKLI